MTHTPTPEPPSPGEVIRALGYDPDAIQSIVVTPTRVVAVAADYPDPHTREDTSGDR